MNKERYANIDLLRIIAMFFILVIHCVEYGTVWCDYAGADVTDGWALANWAGMYWTIYLVSVGVNCFVMMSGFLLAEATAFRWKGAVKLWFTTLFYSFGIALLLVACGKEQVSVLPKYVLPIYNDTYWFITQFIALTLLSPFLARLVAALSKRDYLIMLVVLSFLNLRLFKFPYGATYGGGRTLVWFVFLFFVGAFIKRYRPFSSFKHFGKCYLIFGVLLASAYMVMGIYLNRKNGEPLHFGNTYNNGFTFITSLLLFLWAVNLNISGKKTASIITRVAPFVLGVYLITEHPLLRNWLWFDTLNLQEYQNSPFLIPMQAACCVVLFVIGIVVDYVRDRLFRILHIDHILNKLLS